MLYFCCIPTHLSNTSFPKEFLNVPLEIELHQLNKDINEDLSSCDRFVSELDTNLTMDGVMCFTRIRSNALVVERLPVDELTSKLLDLESISSISNTLVLLSFHLPMLFSIIIDFTFGELDAEFPVPPPNCIIFVN